MMYNNYKSDLKFIQFNLKIIKNHNPGQGTVNSSEHQTQHHRLGLQLGGMTPVRTLYILLSFSISRAHSEATLLSESFSPGIFAQPCAIT